MTRPSAAKGRHSCAVKGAATHTHTHGINMKVATTACHTKVEKKKKEKKQKKSKPAATVTTNDNDGKPVEKFSVEYWNRERAKLGIKPLRQ